MFVTIFGLRRPGLPSVSMSGVGVVGLEPAENVGSSGTGSGNISETADMIVYSRRGSLNKGDVQFVRVLEEWRIGVDRAGERELGSGEWRFSLGSMLFFNYVFPSISTHQSSFEHSVTPSTGKA